MRRAGIVAAYLLTTLSILVNPYGGKAFSNQIKVQSLSPTPNYSLCTDPQDIDQLTDEKTGAYPIWIRKSGVGWAQRGPVKILLTLNDDQHPVNGKILIHTARGTQAGVHLPARLDVYTQGKNKQFYHVTGKTMQDKDYADKTNHWMALEANSVHSPFLIIIRPNGNYLFIDEIKWEGEKNLRSEAQVLVGDLAACEKDSQERYRQDLLARIVLPQETHREWLKAFGTAREVVWVVKNP